MWHANKRAKRKKGLIKLCMQKQCACNRLSRIEWCPLLYSMCQDTKPSFNQTMILWPGSMLLYCFIAYKLLKFVWTLEKPSGQYASVYTVLYVCKCEEQNIQVDILPWINAGSLSIMNTFPEHGTPNHRNYSHLINSEGCYSAIIWINLIKYSQKN